MPRTILALLLTVFFPLAHAATFTVTNLDDSGFGSLRDAITQANVTPGADTINFTVSGTIFLTSGQIAIKGPVSIVGPGATSLTIDANANSRIFSVFATDPACPDFDGPDYLVSISGVRLTNARRTASNGGGAIFTVHSLSLDSVIIDNSKAALGGAVNMQTQYSGQSLTIANSQFLNNTAVPLAGPSNAFGGAVAVFERCTPSKTSQVTVDISNSVFSGNQALPTAQGGNGGALGFDSFANVAITDTRIVGNSVIASNTPLAGNTFTGGGIFARAHALTIVRTEIANNSVSDPAGGDIVRGGGLQLPIVAADRQTTADTMHVAIVNSTISGNTSTATAGAMFVNGNVALEIYNSTVSDNVAAPTRTGGIVMTTQARTVIPSLTVASSILANNSSDGGDIASNVANIPALTVNATNTLIEKVCPPPTCQIAVVGAGNAMGIDPMIGPLAFNSGTTRTHALLAGSPAIDTGSNPLNLTTDQRGIAFPRVVGATADMGAFESNPVAVPSSYSIEYVQKAYVAYYGRPADPAGLDYWAARMDASGGNLDAIIAAFGTSAEFTRRYGGLSNAELVTTIYRQALNRDPDPTGLDFYLNELAAGRKTLQTITLDVINGAVGPIDSATVASKLGVARYYTARVLGGCPYGTAQDGVNSLFEVTGDPLTAAIAEVAIGSRCGP